MTVANKIVDKFIYVVILFLSINTHAEFFEKDESIYFEGSIGSIADIKIAHERNDSWISYILNDSSKDDKWAIITRATDTIGSRTTESRFLYYYPKKIALHETLHNSDLYRILKNKNEEYLKTINDRIIYLADLEGEVKKVNILSCGSTAAQVGIRVIQSVACT